MLVIHYKYLDEINSTITVDFKKETVRAIDYTDNVIHTAFGRYKDNHTLTMDDFYTFLSNRCIPLDRYTPIIKSREDLLAMVEKTHGCMAGDYYSMDFVTLDIVGKEHHAPVFAMPDNTNPLSCGFVPCKGRMEKYKIGDIWYKKDYFGYEAANSLFCSSLLKNALDGDGQPIFYVPYHIETIEGCHYSVSEDFLGLNGQLYSLADLYQHIRGSKLYDNMNFENTFLCLVSFMEQELHMTDAGKYLAMLYEWDAFCSNKVRHADDIYLIRENDNTFSFAPFFNFDDTWLGSVKETQRTAEHEIIQKAIRKHYGRQLYMDTSADYTDTFLKIREVYGTDTMDKFKKLVSLYI